MRKYYLAIDIGRSFGRHLLGTIEDNGKIGVNEIYTFQSQTSESGEYQPWNLKHLFGEILKGMKECKRIRKVPFSVGVTGLSNSFVLLNQNDQVLFYSPEHENRDYFERKGRIRLDNKMCYEETGCFLSKELPLTKLLLMQGADKKRLNEAESLLLLPDYLHYLLCGKKTMEYTNAKRAGFIHLQSDALYERIIADYDIPSSLFADICMPETYIGNLREEMKEEVGYDTKVVLPATDPLYSALLAIPSKQDDFMFVQSQTWASIGCVSSGLLNREMLYKEGIQVMGGYDGRDYMHKPAPGLWLLQCIRMEYGDEKTNEEVIESAKEACDFPSVIDIKKSAFHIPLYVVKSIQEECEKTKQKVPHSLGEVAQVAVKSIMNAYMKDMKELETIYGMDFERIYIMGEGAGNEYLNNELARITGKTVYSGPEAISAIGNIIVQMLYGGEFLTLEKARKCVRQSFSIRKRKITGNFRKKNG